VIAELAARFEARFGTPPELGARAPGRVNLIGEHTDYNEGLVLPCAIDRQTVAWVARREGARVRVFSGAQGEELRCFETHALRRGGDWLDYVQGVVFALRERGVAVAGFDLALASDVPAGAGLSSSAALELAVVTALDASQGLGLDATERARLAHRAENGFAGVACGIMDPFASALGRRHHALRLDCRSQAVEALPLPAERVGILIAHSGVGRALSEGGAPRPPRDPRERARGGGLRRAAGGRPRDAGRPAARGHAQPARRLRGEHARARRALPGRRRAARGVRLASHRRRLRWLQPPLGGARRRRGGGRRPGHGLRTPLRAAMV
jgi:galactokinase